MKRNRLLWALVLGLFFYGAFVGLKKGGEDFRVFYHAASLVASGRGSEIYQNSPDRYLYAPGIAWLLFPFSWFSVKLSYGIWTFLKLIAVIGSFRILSRRFGAVSSTLAFVAFARPFLIEIRYGQVNLFILFTSLWALDDWCRGETRMSISSWAAAAASAVMKLFPGSVLLVPFFGLFLEERKKALRPFVIAVASGVGICLLPALSLGLGSVPSIHLAWIEALRSKGFPLETHNQSFTAFLMHLFSGKPFYALTLGAGQKGTVFGWAILSESSIFLLGTVFSLVGILALIGLAYRIARTRDFFWAPILIAGLILPSHLVWKPYFVLAIPVAAQAFGFLKTKARLAGAVFSGVFFFVNLTSLDVIGPLGTAYFEAYAGLFWVTIAIIFGVLMARIPAKHWKPSEK